MGRIGIMAALYDEIAVFLDAMGPDAMVTRIGLRDYYQGEVMGMDCVVVLARVGKVAAAATAVTLIREFDVKTVVFTGLAGAVAPQLKVGDVVVARTLLQHDMDASPLFPRHEIPLLGLSCFEAPTRLTDLMTACARDYLRSGLLTDVSQSTLHRFGVRTPAVHSGMIVSGDCFVNDAARLEDLRSALPDALCVEMEGAAVAQICHEYGAACVVLRTISDHADAGASVDFLAFLTEVARYYSAGILRQFLRAYAGISHSGISG